MVEFGQKGQGQIDHVRNRFERHPARAPLNPRRRRSGKDADLVSGCDPACHLQTLGPQAGPAHDKTDALSGLDQPCRFDQCPLLHLPARRDVQRRSWFAGLVPGRIGRQDQGRDATRRGAGGGNRRCGIGRRHAGIRGGTHPVGIGARGALDVRGQRRVILLVIGGMVADDIDHRCAGSLGIVQIGNAIAEARSKMQQRHRRFVGHAAIAVGGAGDDALEQAEHTAHAGNLVQGGNKMHFRRARIGKADIGVAGQQGPDNTFGAVHGISSDE